MTGCCFAGSGRVNGRNFTECQDWGPPCLWGMCGDCIQGSLWVDRGSGPGESQSPVHPFFPACALRQSPDPLRLPSPAPQALTQEPWEGWYTCSSPSSSDIGTVGRLVAFGWERHMCRLAASTSIQEWGGQWAPMSTADAACRGPLRLHKLIFYYLVPSTAKGSPKQQPFLRVSCWEPNAILLFLEF